MMSNAEIQDPCGFDAVPSINAFLFRRDAEAERRKAEAKAARDAAFARWGALNPPCACHGSVLAAWDEAEDEAQKRKEAAAMRKLLREQWRGAGMPERVMRTLEGQTEDTQARRVARQFAAGEATFLLLVGGPGTGKTTAAVEALMQLSKPSSGMFIQASRCGQLGLFADEDRETLDNMRRVQCLVLDDLGTEFLSENSVWRGLVDGLLDARYAAMKRTIITTNLGWEALSERYGKRAADRLRHDMVLGNCGAKSMRAPRGSP